MAYKVRIGERIEPGVATSGVSLMGIWANIFVDCCGTCEPQQSIGLRFVDNREADAMTDERAEDVFMAHHWTHRGDRKGWRCPACSQALPMR